MTDLLDRAFENVKALPTDLQDEVARIMLAFSGANEPVLELTPTERADLIDALAEVDRGETATESEAQAVFANYRL